MRALRIPHTAGLRIAYFWATWEVSIAGFLSREPGSVTSTLPDDAKVHHIVLDERTRRMQVFFTSDTLEPVPEGGVIPEFEPLISFRAIAERKVTKV